MIKCGNCGIELAGGENSCFNCRYSQTWAKESASWKSWERIWRFVLIGIFAVIITGMSLRWAYVLFMGSRVFSSGTITGWNFTTVTIPFAAALIACIFLATSKEYEMVRKIIIAAVIASLNILSIFYAVSFYQEPLSFASVVLSGPYPGLWVAVIGFFGLILFCLLVIIKEFLKLKRVRLYTTTQTSK